MAPSVVLVSNRGPLSFSVVDGTPIPHRGAGGLVSGVGPIVEETKTPWIAAAMSDGDRVVAGHGVVDADGLSVRLLAVEPSTYRASYDVVCNATLWYAHHALWDLPRRPRFDRRWWEAWDAYRAVNRTFAEAVAESAADEAVVLVQDYHLSLVGRMLRDLRPDLVSVHFAHTPFATAADLGVLPDAARVELLDGLAGHDAIGFHSSRWARRFDACLAEDGLGLAKTFVSPLASDPADLRASAASEACATALVRLDEVVGDRTVIARVDRIELSKNILRGFLAYELLLAEHAELRDRVVFVASVYPSREGLADYLAYRQEVAGLAARINERFGTATWTPVLLDTTDDFPASVAVLRRYDVLVVNPVVDGLNLVAREGPLVNEREGVVCLSRGAGVWDELGDHAIPIHAFDIAGAADALHRAVTLPADERATRARALRATVEDRVPADWWADQLTAAGR